MTIPEGDTDSTSTSSSRGVVFVLIVLAAGACLALGCLLSCAVLFIAGPKLASRSTEPTQKAGAVTEEVDAADTRMRDEESLAIIAAALAKAQAIKAFRERLAEGKPYLYPTTMKPGDVGRLPARIAVLQLQPNGSFLGTVGGETVLFEGLDTEGLVDGRRFDPGLEVFEVAGTISYTNTLNARRTVLLLRRLEVPDELKKPPEPKASKHDGRA